MTTDERLERLTGIVDALASSVVAHDSVLDKVSSVVAANAGTLETLARSIEAHDRQIDALLTISEENARKWENLERQWQAYLNSLPRQ